MGEPARKAFLFGVAMFLLAAFITICVIIYNKGQNVVNKSDKQLTTTVSNISQGDLSDYDGTNVRGDKVISAVNKYANSQFLVTVNTSAGTKVYGGIQKTGTDDVVTVDIGNGDVTTSSGYRATNINDPAYIESNSSFRSDVGKTTNGTANSLTFTQITNPYTN